MVPQPPTLPHGVDEYTLSIARPYSNSPDAASIHCPCLPSQSQGCNPAFSFSLPWHWLPWRHPLRACTPPLPCCRTGSLILCIVYSRNPRGLEECLTHATACSPGPAADTSGAHGAPTPAARREISGASNSLAIDPPTPAGTCQCNPSFCNCQP